MDARNIGHGPGSAAPDAPLVPLKDESPTFAAPGLQGIDQQTEPHFHRIAGCYATGAPHLRRRPEAKPFKFSLRARILSRIWLLEYRLEEYRQAHASQGRHLRSAACCIGLAVLASRRQEPF